MNETEKKQKLAQADMHVKNSQWNEAIACYDEVLDEFPNDEAALEGKRRAEAKKGAEAQILQHLYDADSFVQAGRYEEALLELERAQELASKNEILDYHSKIRRRRDEAREELHWQTRINQDMSRVGALENQPQEALKVLDALLRDLAIAGHRELGQEAYQLQKDLRNKKNLPERLKDINHTLKQQQDFRLAAEMVNELLKQERDNEYIGRMNEQMTQHWQDFERRLKEVEQELNKKELANAVDLLQQLGQDSVHNPDRKALWVRAHIDHARTEMERGRQAIAERAFDEASTAFKKAQAAFQATLDVFPEHQEAKAALDEMKALNEVALYAAQAQGSMAQANWSAAEQALVAANQKLQEATEIQNDKFRDVAVVLELLMAEISGIVEAIKKARQLLRKGQEQLQARSPASAQACFEQGIQQLAEHDDALLKQLLAGRLQAQALQEEVNRLLEQATAQSRDLLERLKLFQEAHDLWPSAPNMPRLWVDALLEAAKQANNLEQAASYYGQIASIPDVPEEQKEEAQRMLKAVEAEKAVQAIEGQVELLENDRRLPPVAKYEQIVETLAQAEAAAADQNELKKRITSRLQKAQQRLEQLQQAEKLVEDAEAHRQQGEWGEAVRLLQNALDLFAHEANPTLKEQLAEWQKIATELNKALQTANQALQEATQHYQMAHLGDLSAVPWNELQGALARAQHALANKAANAEPLPAAWSPLTITVEELKSSSQVLADAYQLVRDDKAKEALPKLKTALAQRPNDPVLLAVHNNLEQEIQHKMHQQAQALLHEAQELAQRGETEAAQEKLAEAKALDASAEVSSQMRRLERQISLWRKVSELEMRASATRNSNSPKTALNEFKKVLQTVRDLDSGLPEGVRALINKLLVLENTLHEPDVLAESRKLIDQIRVAALENRLISYYLLNPVQAWHELAVRSATIGFITSQVELKKWEQAYTTAIEFVRTAPQDIEAVTQTADIQVKWSDSILSSIEKRLARAEELQERGVYKEALDVLAEIENKLLKPVNDKFPEIGDNDEIQEALARTNSLQTELSQLQEVFKKVEPLVSQVREVYIIEGDLAKARERLMEAKLADPNRMAKLLWKELDELEKQIEQRRQRALRSQVTEALSKATTALDIMRTVEEARQSYDELSSIRQTVQELVGPEGQVLRDNYTEMANQMKRRLDELEAIGFALEKAEAAAKSNHYNDLSVAVKELQINEEQALGKQLVHLRSLLNRLQRKIAQLDKQRAAEEQRKQVEEQRKQAWNNALIAYQSREFEKAKQLLEEASRLGQPIDEVGPYKQAVNAGRTLEQAKAIITNNPSQARMLLHQIQIETENCPPADRLRQDVQHYLKLAEEEEQKEAARREEEARRQAEAEAKRQQIASLFRLAKSAFNQNQLEEAKNKLAQLFKLDPDHPDGQALQEGLNKAMRADKLLKQARERRMDREYEMALNLVDQALTLHPDRIEVYILQIHLQAEHEASQALKEARSKIENEDFAQARQHLTDAREKNPSHPQLRDVQEELSVKERRWHEQKLLPYEDALRKGEYRRALQELTVVMEMKPPVSAEFMAQLKHKEQQTVDDWAGMMITQTEEALENNLSPKQLRTTKQDVAALLAMERLPSKELKERLEQLARQIEIRRLEQQLEKGKQYLKEGELLSADRVADEVIQKAKELDDFFLSMEATSLKSSVEYQIKERKKAQTEEEQRQAQAKRDRHMAEARQKASQAQTLDDLKEAQRSARQALKVPGFENDRQAQQLDNQLTEEIKRFELTNKALTKAWRSLRNGDYTDARQELSYLSEISALLEEKVERMNKLARDLEVAKSNRWSQEQQKQEAALETFLRVSQKEARLAASLEEYIQQCQQDLLDKVIEQANNLLNQAAPDFDGALKLLEEAEKAGWVTTRLRFDALRQRAEHLALISQAANLIRQDEKLTEALELLDKVRHQMPNQRLDELGVGWKAVAHAQLALRAAHLREAKTWFDQIPVILSDEPVVQQLGSTLNSQLEQEEQLSKAEKEVHAAFNQHPLDYQRAVIAARQAMTVADSPHERAQKLVADVQKHLTKRIGILRQREAYSETTALIALLRQLLPGDSSAETLEREIKAEQASRLNEALNQAQKAIKSDDLEEAEAQLRRAEALEGEGIGPSSQITKLRQELEKRREELQKSQELAQQARQEMLDKKFGAAVTTILEGYALAPQDDLIQQLLSDLAEELKKSIDNKQQTGHYHEALQLCNDALRLNHESFSPLHHQVLQKRRQTVTASYEQARTAFKRFDLPAVTEALKSARLANPDDERLKNLTQQLGKAQEVVQELREEQKVGWQQLEIRAFDEANITFKKVATLASPFDFGEPALWQRYTSQLADGVKFAREQNSYQKAAQSFEEAQKLLHDDPEEALSPLWGESLRSRRRRAVSYAQQLKKEVSDIASKLRRANQLRVQRKLRGAMELLGEVKQQQQQLAHLVQRLSEPQSDFDSFTSKAPSTSNGQDEPPTQSESTNEPQDPSGDDESSAQSESSEGTVDPWATSDEPSAKSESSEGAAVPWTTSGNTPPPWVTQPLPQPKSSDETPEPWAIPDEPPI